MTGRGQSGKKKVAARQVLSLSERTHQQILDYFQVAEKSEHAAIRDAAIDLAKDASRHQHIQDAKLSPNVAMMMAVLLLVSAVAASWYFFTYYPVHAYILSAIAVGVALVGACLLAMFSGHLSQANFIHVVGIVWSKFTGWIPRANAPTNQPINQESELPSDDGS